MKEVVIDIETVPGQQQWVRNLIAKDVGPPANYKKQETIDKWYEEKFDAAVDKALHKTGFDATMGEIAVICFAVDNGDVIKLWRDPMKGESEAELLRTFFVRLHGELHGRTPPNQQHNRPKFVGHYVGFDLGFIWRRSVINHVQMIIPIPYSEPPWSENIVDTCQLWTGGDKSTSGGLDTILKALGYAGKSMRGDQVWEYIQQGKILEVVEYCTGDVLGTRLAYHRMIGRTETAVTPGGEKQSVIR